jgi:hypothetical protein
MNLILLIAFKANVLNPGSMDTQGVREDHKTKVLYPFTVIQGATSSNWWHFRGRWIFFYFKGSMELSLKSL